ncbi:MAG: hypothetical protein J6Q32_02400 [Clostridia bacterium]|nr:hypothetical protein [Clostridia bacterium]
MQDFNQFIDGNSGNKNIFDMVSSIASKYNGKNQTELLAAIYQEAKRGKKNGTLTNENIDSFCQVLAPLLDDKQKKMLSRLAKELKSI